MARIPPEELERLKAQISVERLVEASGVTLKPAGKDLVGRCPFHASDDTPSLVVTPAKNLWHCFGCQIGGGPIDWMMKSRGVSFRHAVELLREGALQLPAARRVRVLPAPVSFDASDLVEGFSGQITCIAVRATDDRDILHYEKVRALAVAPRHVPEVNSFAPAILTTGRGIYRVMLHKLSEYTGFEPSRT